MPYMFLNGGGMRGGPLHYLLGGAPLIAAIRTAPLYRLYSVGDRYPALQLAADGPEPGAAGSAIAGEVYDLPLDLLRDDLLPAEPPELELGVIKLGDGTAALGMILRRPCPALDDLTDITAFGGWRAYLERRSGSGTWLSARQSLAVRPLDPVLPGMSILVVNSRHAGELARFGPSCAP
jgi:hypothetical protein